MNPSPPPRHPHRVTWFVFIALLLFAIVFVTVTVSDLPLRVASHFDASGQANAFMSRSGYTRFVLCFAVGLPLAMVAILRTVYSRAAELKLPNKDYWLAPQRSDATRAFLTAHGVWFGSLLVILGCWVHWLELAANREQPPHLANQSFIALMIVFFLATGVWAAVLRFAFRRPAGS